MRAAHGLVVVLALSAGALVWVLASDSAPQGSEDPAWPDRGKLAPFTGDVPLVPVARIPGGAGPIVDLSVWGDVLAVLTRSQWYLHAHGRLRGGFGDPTPGSPDWISRPVSVAVGEEAVYILEAGRFTVSIWDTSGVRRSEIRLRTGGELSLQPTDLLLGPGGEVVVLSLIVQHDGTGRWEALAYRDGDGAADALHPGYDAPETLLSLEGKARSFIFDRPYLAYRGEQLLGATALTQTFFKLRRGSEEMELMPECPHSPLWYVPPRQQRRYAGLLQRMGGVTAGISQLPEFWPPVRGLTVRPDGSLILAVSAGEEHQHLELLTWERLPLRRFSVAGFLDPVFVHGGRAFLVKEDLNETVIYEFVIEPQ